MGAKLRPGPELLIGSMVPGQLSPSDQLMLLKIAEQAFKVRSLQREYYKNRSNDVLIECKQEERNLDCLLTMPAQGGLGI